MKSLQIILGCLLLLSFSKVFGAEHGTYNTLTDVSISADKCAGTITFGFLYLNTSDTDEKLEDFRLYVDGTYVLYGTESNESDCTGTWYEHSDGSDWCVIKSDDNVSFREDNLENNDHWLIVTYKVPEDKLGQEIEFKLTGVWSEGGTIKQDFTGSGTPIEKTATIDNPAAPTALSASTDECNQIILNWTDPNVTCDTLIAYMLSLTPFLLCPDQEFDGTYYKCPRIMGICCYTIEVSRDGGDWVDVGKVNTYTDNTVEDGTEYEYRIRTKFTNMNDRNSYSDIVTAPIDGHSIALLSPPSGLSATGTCSGTVEVTWQWSSANPEAFEIARSTSENGDYTVLSSSITGDKRKYVNDSVTAGSHYYYKLKTKNVCEEWGDYSSATDCVVPHVPEAPGNLNYSVSNNTVQLKWTDNSNNETGFILRKSNVVSGVVTQYDLASNTTSFDDNELELCVPYVYRLKATGDCGSSAEVATGEIGLTPDLSNTFWEGSFKASKGYYADIVHLEWDNNNRSQIELFYIYRKEYGSTDSLLLTTLNGTLTTFDDKYAENGVIYEYSIKGEGRCNEISVFSNVASSIGFKIPTAVISGKVTYKDDNPTKGVTITAESTELPAFSSIGLNGTNAYMKIDDLVEDLPVFTFQAYMRFNSTGDAAIFNRGTQYKLNYASNAFVFGVGGDNLTCSYTPPLDTFVQVTAVYDGSISYLYIDGVLKASKTGVSEPSSNSSSFILGKEGASSFFNGYIDEIRLWKTALDSSTVVLNYNKYIGGNEAGIMGYYRLNENVDIDMFFDVSRTGGSYNEHHGVLYNCTYEDVNPDVAQLWFKAVTDETGNFLITGLPYLSGGSIYKIVPMMAPHEFNPAYKTLYVSNGASVHNNIDFVDISTVNVAVEVFYNNTTFPVSNVYVKLDGQVQIDRNEKIIQTDETGKVDFEVPYGNHYLSFEKPNHLFGQPYYPGIDEYGNIIRHNFTEPVKLDISDTTRVKLAGKIVGGPIEADKDLLSNIDPTKNNIGTVTIELTTERGYDIDLDQTPKTVSTTTDPETGYFEFYLLPEVYKPNGQLAIKNNLYLFNSDDDLAIIDMTSKFIVSFETDSIFLNDKFSHLDTTASYNLRRDWIYRSEPEFSVYNNDGGKIISETEFVYENGTDTIPLAVEQDDSIFYPFGYPIFLFANEYSLTVNAYEEYINADNQSLVDHVAVTDGVLMISNDLALEEKVLEMSLDDNGEAKYSFLADFPNIADPYTKNLNITFKAGSTIVQWPENGEPYEAYILGGRPTGNNFVTTGPSVVDYILRDPPGSNSSATLRQGYVTASKHSWSVSNVTDMSLGLTYQMGAAITTQAGSPFFMVQTKFETDNNIKGVIQNSYTGGTGYEQSTQLSFNESFSTSDDPLFVGSDADVFIGHSTNIVYGISKMMEIMPRTEVEAGKDTIARYDSYAISIKDGLRVNPEFDTYFIYSQRIIEQENIPHLKQLRNILLERSCYEKVFTDINDPKYGTNNDDSNIWGSLATEDFYDGPSYKYTPVNDSIIDSVRYYNAQIANWEEILAMNEMQKVMAAPDQNHRNISFGAGSIYNSSLGSEYSYTDNTTFAFSVGLEVATTIGFSLNKFGFKLDASVKNTTSGTENWSSGTTETKEVSYTLSDQDMYNYITADVSKCMFGNGPVFKTRGGQTSCPYEKEELTQYYMPGVLTLNNATMRIDGMKLAVENPISPLIPETAPAVFTLNLSNVSEAEKDGWYILGVDVASNPYGAKVRMDGGSINDGVAVFIPYGKTVTKTIEVWKGRADINEYEDIDIYLQSTCENVSEDVLISAYFASACSEAEIEYPGNGWVINTDNNDTMYVQIGGYNLQHDGFEDIHFQYTPTGSSNWTTAHIFTNDFSKAGDDNTTYIDGATTLEYYWDMKSLADRGYDIQLVSHCEDGSVNYSEVLSGILDGKRPQVFGTPQPADGILNTEDDILVQFNESIEGGLLTSNNFELKGTLNNYPLKHQAFLRYNGISDYSAIPEGISFNDKSFTIEFWMRVNSYTNAIVFSQGNDPDQSIEIGITDAKETTLKIGNLQYTVGMKFSTVMPDDVWQHMAYVFDYETGDVFIYQNDETLLEERGETVNFYNTGRIYLGKSSETGGDYFNGELHELRLWTRIWSSGEIYANQSLALSGNEIGLYGYWPLDDAFGTLAVDKAANRHMEVYAPWIVEPGGKAWDFAGDHCLGFLSGYFAIIPEMDYTVEFWFKSDTPSDTACLFSCQKGDGNDGTGSLDKTLSIYATPDDGKIWVASKGYVFEAVTNNYFDKTWHHFALVVRRRGNVTSLVDGEPQNEKENSIVGGIAGDTMHLGVRKWENTASDSGEDWYYSGKLDEFRLWNLAKTTTQIKMDMNSKLTGDETGLMVYFPFEGYYDNGFGGLVLQETLENFVSDSVATPCNINSYTNDAPNIKEVRPVEEIAFDWVAADDRIIIMPKEYLLPQLEKNLIEMTVKNVEDKYGNRLASPVTWMAYVHRNQVRWEDERRIFAKEVYQTFSFVASIKNTGGQQVGFSIQNLPVWLTAYPSSGVINPESTLEINFVVNPALNIGEYNVDVVLRTENGFDEKLPVTIRVHKNPPAWKVDPSYFENTMTIVGKIKVDGVFSTDVSDMLAAFKHGSDSIRGVANVRYIEEFDSYLVFLTVYGNIPEDKKVADSLDFQIWDASAGMILDNVSPFEVVLVDNTVMGTTVNPVIFETTGSARQHIILQKGWNWVSFNKLSPDMNSFDKFFWSLEPDNKDLIKTQDGFVIYSKSSEKWSTDITSLDYRLMYQIKISKLDTIVFSGTSLEPEATPIPLRTGWNYIGYIPDLTMSVKDALRRFVPSQTDIIKSQDAFAMYDPRVGWLGTLDVMQPGEGYMLKVNGTEPLPLTYPNTTTLKSGQVARVSSHPLDWQNDFRQFEGNLSIVARLDLSNATDVFINSQMALGAFIDNECHGFISPLESNELDYVPFFLNVNNNTVSGQSIQFRLYDGSTGKTYSIKEILPFRYNAVYGTLNDPMVMTLNGLITGQNEFENTSWLRFYPNPFNTEIAIEFSGMVNAETTIEVISMTGSLIKTIYKGIPANGINSTRWDGTNERGNSVAPSVYFIRMISGNTTETFKISKTK